MLTIPISIIQVPVLTILIILEINVNNSKMMEPVLSVKQDTTSATEFVAQIPKDLAPQAQLDVLLSVILLTASNGMIWIFVLLVIVSSNSNYNSVIILVFLTLKPTAKSLITNQAPPFARLARTDSINLPINQCVARQDGN